MIDGVTTTTTAQTDITSAVKGGQMGKQEFLQLLVTQLRNQDPLNPSDPQDFAAQLAQFSTLEQLINIGDKLEESAATDQALIQMFNSSSALNLIGKNVIAEGDGVTIPQAGGAVNVTVAVGGEGGSGVVRLFDAAGKEVGSMPLGQLAPGRQTLDISQLTAGQPAGDYTYVLEVKDATGASVTSQTYTVAQVDGVKYTSNGPVLVCGDQTIALNAVVEISN